MVLTHGYMGSFLDGQGQAGTERHLDSKLPHELFQGPFSVGSKSENQRRNLPPHTRVWTLCNELAMPYSDVILVRSTTKKHLTTSKRKSNTAFFVFRIAASNSKIIAERNASAGLTRYRGFRAYGHRGLSWGNLRLCGAVHHRRGQHGLRPSNPVPAARPRPLQGGALGRGRRPLIRGLQVGTFLVLLLLLL